MMRKRTTWAALAATVALAVAATVAAVARATTGPSSHVLVNVAITNTAIRFSTLKVHDVTFVDFYLHNDSKLPHDFKIGVQKSALLHPGERLHFYVGFPKEGFYTYEVLKNGTKAMRGRFHVTSPQLPD